MSRSRVGGAVAAAAMAAVLAISAADPSGARGGTTTAAAAARRAVAYLVRAENSDGGFGGRPRQSSAQLFSGWAALGLASAGRDPARLRARSRPAAPTLLSYISRGASAHDAGSIERTVLVAVAAGRPAARLRGRSLVRELARRFSRGGAVSGQVNLTAFGVLALAGAGADPGLQARGRAWLAGQQDRDGGWNYAGRGGASDPDDTGAVLEALDAARGRHVASARARGVAYLNRTQRGDGGFASAPGEGSNTQSTAWAVQGLLAARGGPRVRARALRYLEAMQKPDGAVRYSRDSTQTPVWVTAQALMALEGKALPIVGR